MPDDAKLDAIAVFIAQYRAAERPPYEMCAAVLEAFRGATTADYAVALLNANRIARAAAGSEVRHG